MTPHMIGDLFGGGQAQLNFRFIDQGRNGSRSVTLPVGNAAGVGFVKMAENGSPIPIDRVFYNFSDYTDVPLTSAGTNVNRSVPGFEKTFFNRWASLEIRTPFASTADPNVAVQNLTNTTVARTYQQTLFGDVSLTYKQALIKRDRFIFSTGLQTIVPTAQSGSINFPTGYQISIRDQSTHVMPFVGWWYAPNERAFTQAILQVDVDTNGNRVVDNVNGMAGRMRDPTYFYVDMSFGYWMIRDPERRGLTGLAPVFEFHVNDPISKSQAVNGLGIFNGLPGAGNGSLAYSNSSSTLVNLSAGLYATFNERTSLTLGYCTPVSDAGGRQFSNEFRAFVNWRFGPSSRAAALGPY